MRTTLTLDDDVAARLERLRRERNASFKSVVNEVMRRGFASLDRGVDDVPAYRLEPRYLGSPRIALDSVQHALAIGEGENHR